MIAVGDTVRVRGFHGVACTYIGPQIERYWDLDEGVYPDDPEERETGMALVCMVGDDHDHVVDPDDMSPLDESEYCDGCGQIGCGHSSRRES